MPEVMCAYDDMLPVGNLVPNPRMDDLERRRKYARERMRRMRVEQPEHIKELKRASRERHRDECNARDRARYAKNKETIRARMYANRVPEQRSAYAAVRYAVRVGKLSRPDSCPECGRNDLRIEAHHHRGYEHKLDVVWLCRSCHAHEHQTGCAK